MEVSKVLRAGAAWWAVLIFPVVLSIPFLLPAAVGVLRFVLEGLNSFGQG